jgi:K+-sensing histidine kinase KdpD
MVLAPTAISLCRRTAEPSDTQETERLDEVESEREALVERIVVGVDGSAEAGRALRWAAEEARLRHAALDVVHAWHTPYFNGYPYATAPFDVVSGLVLVR